MRHALVTGASSGIGRASAIALQDAGFHVWAGVRTELDAEAIRDDEITPVTLDVTDPAQVQEAATKILVLSEGRLDALVNNAGIAVTDPIEVLSDFDLKRQFEVNVFGLHRVTRTFLPSIIKAKGRVVNIGSISGRVGFPLMGPYVASKHALEGYTDTLRREVRHLGVKVAIIQPGQVDTPIWDKSIPPDEYLQDIPAHYRELAAPLLERARLGNTTGIAPEEVAAVVVHACKSRLAKARYALPLREKVLSRVGGLVPEAIMDRIIDNDLRKGEA